MKKLFSLIAILCAIFLSFPAFGWETSLILTQNTYADEDIESHPALKLTIDNDWYYFFLSGEDPFLGFGGQEICHAYVYGVGVGVKQALGPFVLRSDLGYYFSRERLDGSLTMQEGLYIHSNQEAAPYQATHPYYNYSLGNNVGGSLSIEYTKALSNRWAFSLFTGYRYLKLNGDTIGHNDDWSFWWHIPKEQDFSAWQGGFSVTFRF